MASAEQQPKTQFGTSALCEYLWTENCDMSLFSFTVDVVLRGDYVSHVAAQALAGNNLDKSLTPADLAKTQPGVLTTRLRQSSQEFLEMFVCRGVDNFQKYLVDVIRLALHKQPKILSERKQELSLGHILKFDSIEALARDIIESKISALSYEGFGDIEQWCQSKSIPIVVPHGKTAEVVELLALRNIIVHARGVVDDRYKSAVPSTTLEVGRKRELSIDDFITGMQLLSQVAGLTDAAIAGKFGIAQEDLQRDLKKRSAERWPKITDLDEKRVPSVDGGQKMTP